MHLPFPCGVRCPAAPHIRLCSVLYQCSICLPNRSMSPLWHYSAKLWSYGAPLWRPSGDRHRTIPAQSPFIPADAKIVVGAVAPASPDPIPIVLLPGFEYRMREWRHPDHPRDPLAARAEKVRPARRRRRMTSLGAELLGWGSNRKVLGWRAYGFVRQTLTMAKPLKCVLLLHDWRWQFNETGQRYEECARCGAYRDRRSDPRGAASG